MTVAAPQRSSEVSELGPGDFDNEPPGVAWQRLPCVGIMGRLEFQGVGDSPMMCRRRSSLSWFARLAAGQAVLLGIALGAVALGQEPGGVLFGAAVPRGEPVPEGPYPPAVGGGVTAAAAFAPPASAIGQPSQTEPVYEPRVTRAFQGETVGTACVEFRESTWYTRVDYFHWNERSDGQDFVNEDGALVTLGYLHRWGVQRIRGELFGATVNYDGYAQFDDGTLEPLKNKTKYLGLRGEYDLLFEPDFWPQVAFFTGIGTRFWIRDLPDGRTAQGDGVMGYQETWWTIYPYIGIEKRRNLASGFELFSSGRIGFTAVTYQFASLADSGALYPRPDLMGQVECGVRSEHLVLSGYFEAMGWRESAVVRGMLQPASHMITVGLKAGFNF